jgi:hypothetical protein
MHLTLAQAVAMLTTIAAGRLMVQLGASKKAFRLRDPARCVSCGRRLSAGRCRCTSAG